MYFACTRSLLITLYELILHNLSLNFLGEPLLGGTFCCVEIPVWKDDFERKTR